MKFVLVGGPDANLAALVYRLAGNDDAIWLDEILKTQVLADRRPTSDDASAFQIMLANALLDAVRRGCTDKIKRGSAGQMGRLFYAAAIYLATGDKRLEDATEYLMGCHIDSHAKLVEIEARQ